MSDDDLPNTLHAQGHLKFLIESVLDWQIQHGSLIKFPLFSGEVTARPIGATLEPSPFPKDHYDDLLTLQLIFNKLYAAVSEDEEFLIECLQGLMQDEKSMAKMLWDIHTAVKEEGHVQATSLGIFRSDYMLHLDSDQGTVPKQVEFNTYSVAGGAHGNRVSDMHRLVKVIRWCMSWLSRYLTHTGAYGRDHENADLPVNCTLKSIAEGLACAHTDYGDGKAYKTAILMIVQPNNVNICDEKPIQEALWNQNIPCYRVIFGIPTLTNTGVTDSKELLYKPLGGVPVEISVVYHRAGYDLEEYNDVGLETRYQLERSKAIKCPSILGHLATLKLVQQKLADPDVLERYLSQDEAHKIRNTFMPMYTLDQSEMGTKGRKLAFDHAKEYVLKPSLEGGGHNVYRGDIPDFLKTISKERWSDYILMEMIDSPPNIQTLVSPQGIYHGPTYSELGVFGICLWRRENGFAAVVRNVCESTSLKTKRVDVDEMSVIKGFGCFDSPSLIAKWPSIHRQVECLKLLHVFISFVMLTCNSERLETRSSVWLPFVHTCGTVLCSDRL